MKLLFLSTCGKTKEAEDVSYINLYLASLKKHVVPHYDLKVILFNNALSNNSSESETWKRVQEFGLQDIVEVKNIFEMGLPEKSVQFMQDQNWFGKIGLNMNMLFDYSKQHNFFDADWVFHFDTDLEFLPNFKQVFEKVYPITEVNPEVIITVGGDTYPYNIRYGNTEFIFDEPTRMNIYDETTLSHNYNLRNLKINERKTTDSDFNPQHARLVFNLQQQKVRNDFVGMSKSTAMGYGSTFNWISCHYPNEFIAKDKGDQYQVQLENLWKEFGSNKLQLTVNHDKGSLIQLFLQSSYHNIVKVQLRGYQDMARHYSSGWYDSTSFGTYALDRLKKDYQDTADIWERDYLSKEEIESKITDLQHQINKLQQQLGRFA